MQNQDWYAPPKAQVGTLASTTCSRDGQFVVVQAGSDLPARCIVCNAPLAAHPKKAKLYWHNPWLYLLVPINILVYLIVALIVRQSAEVSPGFCAQHTTERRNRILMFTLGGAATLVGGVLLISAGQAAFAIVCFLLGLLVLVLGMIASRKVYVKKITKTYARLGGCKEPFLASLK